MDSAILQPQEYADMDYESTSEPCVAEWDIFLEELPQADTSEAEGGKFVRGAVRVAKFIVCIATFLLVLVGAIVAKGSILFMTSQLRPQNETKIPYCKPRGILFDETCPVVLEAELPEVERVSWVWALLFALLVPEIGSFLRSVRIMSFKPKSCFRPRMVDLLVVLVFEVCGVIGISMLAFSVLPDLDVLSGIMLTNCVAHVPIILGLLGDIFMVRAYDEFDGVELRRHSSMSSATSTSSGGNGFRGVLESSRPRMRLVRLVVGSVALLAQLTGFIAWPLVNMDNTGLWIIPPALLLTSCAWWENYANENSSIGFLKFLGVVKANQKRCRYPTYVIVSVCKMITFYVSMMVIWAARGESVPNLYNLFSESFALHQIPVTQTVTYENFLTAQNESNLPLVCSTPTPFTTLSHHSAAWLLLITVGASYVCYITGKYACRILIQGFSYATPVALTVPTTLCLLIVFCSLRFADACAFEGVIPGYLFFTLPPSENLGEFLGIQHAWIWLFWLASQLWATIHIWWPKCQRLAPTEKIFVTPMYSALLIDQTLAFNRRRDDEPDKERGQKSGKRTSKEDREQSTNTVSSDDIELATALNAAGVEGPTAEDAIPKIFACATMWHETREEMVEMLKSVMRMDEDQSAHSFAKEFFGELCSRDYYEFETHIFFDDAFVSDNPLRDDSRLVNSYVRDFLRTVDEAASFVHETQVQLRPPKVLATPYGGQLRWTLPGKTQLVVHLKNSAKIRHKKRWSQVMYMYYLLSHKLLNIPVSARRKDVIAENTYLLALDGDIDFQPAAVHKLVDLMKKDRNLGAACGRIHPIGSGPMQWYQKFEYAVGHWLQKATEHVIGCVLCSPGCFSLFRGSALQDTNVMKKYTTMSEEARHYVQYDQGEDRWLCTLLLQRGYRVEYSAASDALTHCPESFHEFYNQRRRWVPSTMANIMDLLSDYKQTVKANDNISTLYILYQILLLVGSILGPGTILLMLVGSFVTVFGWSDDVALVVNVVPIIIYMIICYFAKNDTQITVAAVYSVVYAFVMMAVLIGILVQISEDGPLAPTSLFFFIVAGQLIIAALLHPRELDCLVAGLVYFITVPSMYMLLIIYSLFNLNNVSWGTRETPKPPGSEPVQPVKKAGGIKGFLQSRMGGGSNVEEDATCSFALGNLFNCMFCTHPKPNVAEKQSIKIAESLETIQEKVEGIERIVIQPQGILKRRSFNQGNLSTLREEEGGSTKRRESEGSESSSGEESGGSTANVVDYEEDKVSDTYWIDEDPELQNCEVEFISTNEERFWVDLIATYLEPLKKNAEKEAKVAKELKDLRDKAVFGFFMINAMFVFAIFLIQKNRDISFLNIDWPLNQGSATTFNSSMVSQNPTEWHIYVSTAQLQLEPIGLLFLASFALVLFIQFLAMLYHRFGTFSHIMATSRIECFCTKKTSGIGEEDLSRRGVAIVKELQRLRELAEEDSKTKTLSAGKPPRETISRRPTIGELEKKRLEPPRRTSLAEAFGKRLLPEEGGQERGTVNKDLLRRVTGNAETFEVLMRRRSTVIDQRRSTMRPTSQDNRSSTIQILARGRDREGGSEGNERVSSVTFA